MHYEPPRRNSSNKYTDAEGHVHSRIRGPNGRARVYVDTIDCAPKHDFVYLIVEFTELNEVVKIVDNRKDDAVLKPRDP
ncbi:hypothetical protein PINS_up010279 [Pythium insidiosum]|nr:hypothetical protein PINS_up010279 [Pythium insidiosum]